MKKIPLVMLAALVALSFSVAPVFAVSYTAQQVSTHNTAANCWAIANSNVYNLTSYIASHPGGQSAITGLCGTDATAAFNAQHGSSSAASTALASLLIGTLGVTDTTAPSAPTSLAASLNSSNKVVLAWTASTDSVGVSGYKIMRGGSQISTSTSASFTDTTVVASTTYLYNVLAFDAAGNNSTSSNSVSITTPAASSTDTTLPSVPTNLMASVISSSQINLSWATSTDNVAVMGYNIYRGGNLIGTSSMLTYNDLGLNPSTAYSYMVSAVDTSGNASAQSAPVMATTSATSTNGLAPSIPLGLVATLNSDNKVVLSWNASTDNVGVTGYTITRDAMTLADATSTNYVDTSVVPDMEYYYAVSAYDADGNESAASADVSITTPDTIVNPGDENGNGDWNHHDKKHDHHRGGWNHRGGGNGYSDHSNGGR